MVLNINKNQNIFDLNFEQIYFGLVLYVKP